MDRLVIDYLKNRGMDNMSEQEFMNKFKHLMSKYKRSSMPKGYSRRDGFGYDMDDSMNAYDSEERFFNMHDKYDIEDHDIHRMMRYMRDSKSQDMSFNEEEAKQLISNMHHIEHGRSHSGEKFDMHKAKELCSRYRSILPSHISFVDMYIAINVQYHNYAELFKSWFGENIDQKIIESAIVFWFKDPNCKAENKIVEYFKEW